MELITRLVEGGRTAAAVAGLGEQLEFKLQDNSYRRRGILSR